MKIAVVGGGMLGSTVALLAADQGWDVTIFESRVKLFAGASTAGEAKIHLGPIYILGDEQTQDLMLRGAVNFAPILEKAVGKKINWEELVSEPFDYGVMPTSLVPASELATRYKRLNSRIQEGAPAAGFGYLGEQITQLVDPNYKIDPQTGLECFKTSERAANPIELSKLVIGAIDHSEKIQVKLDTEVLKIDQGDDAAAISSSDLDGNVATEKFDLVINCAWENQTALTPKSAQELHNFRVKLAVRLPARETIKTITFIQGPFGDVVSHRDHTYASWYPVARIVSEEGIAPSTEAKELFSRLKTENQTQENLEWKHALVAEQLAGLRDVGLFAGEFSETEIREAELTGGYIIGHGSLDITNLASSLHSRSEFGVQVSSRLLNPINYKLTTAPLAALETIEHIRKHFLRKD
ncbi:MAG: FAD-binding oxidoreductase [Cryobacterium sp.]|nr:FAD-binding oxidoreductase [Cryobacterium sp.]